MGKEKEEKVKQREGRRRKIKKRTFFTPSILRSLKEQVGLYNSNDIINTQLSLQHVQLHGSFVKSIQDSNSAAIADRNSAVSQCAP